MTGRSLTPSLIAAMQPQHGSTVTQPGAGLMKIQQPGQVQLDRLEIVKPMPQTSVPTNPNVPKKLH